MKVGIADIKIGFLFDNTLRFTEIMYLINRIFGNRSSA